MKHSRTAQEGFGIVVVALLFTAFAVIAASVIDRSSVELELNRQKQAEAQLTRLSVSLAKFARYNDHRLPCPASWLELVTSGNFGAGVVPCKGASVQAGALGFVSTADTGHKLLIGMVPVRDLVPYGISYNDAFDPWGSRILYAVHRDITPTASDAERDAAVAGQRPNVVDYRTNETTTPAPDTVVISLGRDRAGGRLRAQGALASPSIACSGGQRRYVNCDNDRDFIRGPLYTSSRAGAPTYFDDSISTLRYTP